MCPTWTRARGWADVEHIDAGKLDERVLVLALQETAQDLGQRGAVHPAE